MARERARRVAVGVAVLVTLQAAAVGIYLAVERPRDPAASAVFRVEQVRGQSRAANIVLERADGTRVPVHDVGGHVRLVHFWATWCPPCIEELPGLLATSREFADRGLDLVAISMDDNWAEIRAFFHGDVPPEVYRAVDPRAHEKYDVVSLPDTYLVSGSGRIRMRYGGARDWRSGAARSHLGEQVHLYRRQRVP